ncbi:hypothetical protein EDEG_00471 [Edhazardia aedis USNM 41457]|uniref:Importin N-terminal domain-containing protein n=1 Tax=Edhazardia aedis (strain USNM 41457) TaxID=1003232 RepID=J9D0E0_EDHAE|nr:hypothetical protein EDEG_00471 [Edhazardia aedis USNM 41457]|eukprot:EJW01346.1 hypothetical protein EDEG_00471 [Edhazardia aedis USNM 41457]
MTPFNFIMEETILQLICDALSPNTEKRTQAESSLSNLQNTKFSEFIKTLIVLLCNEETKSEYRFVAGVIARNSLYNINLHLETVTKQWYCVDADGRCNIKRMLFANLKSTNYRAGTVSASVLAAIARIEVLNNEWADFFTFVYNMLNSECEEVLAKNLLTVVCNFAVYVRVNSFQSQIYNIVVCKVSESVGVEVVLHALECLKTVQVYVKDALIADEERFTAALIRVSRLSSDVTACVVSNLNILISYYRKVKNLGDLRLLVNSFFNLEEGVVLQCIEFFNILAEIELEEKQQALEDGSTASSVYVSDALFILPNLFKFLPKDCENEWTPHRASVSCLKAVGSCVDLIQDEFVRQFIWMKLESADISEQEVGIMALGSLVNHSYHGNNTKRAYNWHKKHVQSSLIGCRDLNDYNDNSDNFNSSVIEKATEYECIDGKPFYGPEDQRHCYVYDPELSAFICYCIKKIINFVIIKQEAQNKEESEASVESSETSAESEFNDSCFWCLARLFEFNYQCLTLKSDMALFVEKTQVILQQNTKERLNAAWALCNFFTAMHKCEQNLESRSKFKLNSLVPEFQTEIEPFYYNLAGILVNCCDNVHFNDFQLRNALFCTLTEFIKTASVSEYSLVEQILKYYIAKTDEYLFFVGKATPDQFKVAEDCISNFLVIIQTCYLKIGDNNLPHLKKEVFNLVVNTLSINRETNLFTDIYAIISRFVYKKSYFAINIDKFTLFVIRDLRSLDKNLLINCVNFVGDIANFMCIGFVSLASQIVPALVSILQNTLVNSDVKPVVLSVLGDIALSLGRSFEPYIDMSFGFVEEVCKLPANLDKSFLVKLRRGTIDLLNSIVLAMENSQKISSNMVLINKFLQIVLFEDKDKVLLAECFKLIGTLFSVMGSCENTQWMIEILQGYVNDQRFGKVATENLLLLEE